MVEGRPPLYELELRSDLPTVNCNGPFLGPQPQYAISHSQALGETAHHARHLLKNKPSSTSYPRMKMEDQAGRMLGNHAT